MMFAYLTLHGFACFIGLGGNLLLLWLALTKSSRVMRPCSVLLTCKTITNCFVVFFDAMTLSTVRVREDMDVEVEYHGWCTFIEQRVCYISHISMLTLLNQNLIWLIGSYLFRYYIIYVEEPTVSSMLMASALLSITSLAQIIFWIFNPFLQKFSTILIITLLVLTSFLIIITYFWIRKYILKYIKLHESSLTDEVKSLNKKLIEIIDFQVKMPFLIFTGAICLGLTHFAEQLEVLKYVVTLPLIYYTISSSMCYIYYLPAYKNYVANWISEKSTFSVQMNDQ